ncbi:MAG: SBBP repeat-containing protein [Taibaiella sp.]|nr:SBBP repeat-containing protein [Taibaiella sp.]
MKRNLLFLVFLLFGTLIYAQQPVVFVENKGQWDGPFSYRTMGLSSEFFIEPNGYTVVVGDPMNHEKIHDYKEGITNGHPTLNFHSYRMRWVGAQSPTRISGDKPEPYYMNFYLGREKSKWKSKINPVKAVEIQQIYPGISVRVTSSNFNPKLDYVIAPSADPGLIRLHYSGLDKIEIRDEKLILSTSVGTVTELEPYAYQNINGERVEVACSYKQINQNTIGFELAQGYNHNLELIIDPEVEFASLTGSTSDNWGFTATYDAAGNLYGGGIVNGNSYPTTDGAFQATYGGGTTGTSMPCDIGISKFSSDGTSLLYSTFIGGDENDYPHSMFVDSDGNLFISGKTSSEDFPHSYRVL